MAERPRFGGHAYAFGRPLENMAAKDYFIVRPVEPDDPHLFTIARMIQQVKQEALTEQLEGKVSPQEIALFADPASAQLVRNQFETAVHKSTQRRYGGELGYSQGEYMIAEALVPSTAGALPHLDIIGAGSSYESAYGAYAVSSVVIESVYVRPQFQKAGVGGAIVRSILDDKPQAANVLTTNMAELNPGVSRLLQKLGFVAAFGSEERSIFQEERFGRIVKDVAYRGPIVGELIAKLTRQYPYVANRVAFGPYDKPLG